MTFVSPQNLEITRTERGLVIAGTRITLYQFLDYIQAGYSPQHFRPYFPQITDRQFEAALSYIKAHGSELEREYQSVVKEDAECQQYWEAQNRERSAQISNMPSPLGQESAWAKLQAQKERLKSKTENIVEPWVVLLRVRR
jgi:uncharacterized protein (DUF433 family)